VIRLRTLGALDLRGPGGEELRAVLAQPRRAALLAYLALATPRGYHRRDTLLALFWPEQDTEHARNALGQAVHFLRRSLGADAIVNRNGDALGLDWRAFWCDAAAFEEALDAGQVAEAVGLYRGDLLEGFHIADAAEFERWLDAERARLAGRYTKAVEALAAEREGAGDFHGAVAHWRHLVGRDPYSSWVTLRLMRALAAAGDPAGAVRHARLHEKLLREELDIAPDAEVAALIRQLQSAQSQQPLHPASRASASSLAERPGVANDAGEITTSRSGVRESAAPLSEAERHLAQAPIVGRANHGHPRRRRLARVTAGLVALCAVAGGAAVLRSGTMDAPPIRSIAVLPLENHSGDSAWQAFAEGMHDALITELARYPELRVISRTSVTQYRGTSKRLPEIARELKVDGVVEGALLREGGRVRMTAQLVHGPSDRHLWARSYKRDLRDILLLQEELAAAIAREVRVAAVPLKLHRPTTAGPADSAPQELYLKELYRRGRYAEVSRSLVGLQTAREYYRRAIERDSTFALGYAGLSGVYQHTAFYDFAPLRAALDSARIMARRAVALDSTLPETRTALALSLANAGELDAAEREFKRAIQLGPSNAQAHYWYSMLLVALGRGEEALREAERGLELDPFSPRAALGMKRSALYLITGEHQELKVPVNERRPILKLEPGEPWARARNAVEMAEEGRCAEARSDILRARQLAAGNNIRMLWHAGAVYWLCGERARARALLAEMKRHPDAGDHAITVAMLHTRFGEKDSAFVWLERQPWMLAHLAILSANRFMDPLRSDPRYPQLLRRLGVRKP
jgi:TolB-like protein/DNA-binding SARP family transcriptional activator/Flp pilus assembly protein TadD